jgi:hypothetical protein
MKRFKYKQTDYIAIEIYSKDGYEIIGQQDSFIPKWVIENSNDWEEVEPILTTSDGVDLYEFPEQLYCVLAKNNWQQQTIYWPNQFMKGKDWKCFITREARQLYIDKHKPKFSINDIENAYVFDKSAPLYQIFINNLKDIISE